LLTLSLEKAPESTDPATMPRRRESPTKEGQELTPASILVVDDDLDVLELVGAKLQSGGYQVSFATNGREALDRIDQSPPALVILDVLMPDVDGFEVCRIIHERPETAHIPIIMLSAKRQESEIVRGLELGAEDFVLKPFSPRELAARVSALLRRNS
jgi:two-component system phosphate regulon response regulator PhoB